MGKALQTITVIIGLLVTIAVVTAVGYLLGGWFAAGFPLPGHGPLIEGGWAAGPRIVNIAILLMGFVMIIATLLTLAERKWSAMMQDRIGPNRARFAIPGLRNAAIGGLPHVIADSLKMLFKEDFRPAVANRWLFNLGPILAFAPIFALFAIVPAGPTVQVLGYPVPMVIASPDFGLLYLFAIASLAVYGTSLAGWSSNNKFALLGGVRASSQMISYEVALGLSLVGMMVVFSTVKLFGDTGMVDQQAHFIWGQSGPGQFDIGLPAWGIFLQPVGFVLFFAAAFAETKRAPFDVPEGESEIIGYFVEYSGMKFGMFMISEFVEIVVLSGVLTAIFFGGYHLPFGEQWLRHDTFLAPFLDAHEWVWGAFLGMVFWIKVILLIYLQLAIRWTFPRFRYDQIQTLGWKMLLPVGLVNLFVSAALILWDPTLQVLTVVGLVEIGVVVVLTLSSKQPAAHAAPAAHGHGHEPPALHAAHAPSGPLAGSPAHPLHG